MIALGGTDVPAMGGANHPNDADNDGVSLTAPMKGGIRMSTAISNLSGLSDAEHDRHLRRALIASTVSTTIEWYDFLLYGTVAGLVFGKLFFPGSEPLIGVLQAFGVFFIGFVGRPIGAAIFGHYGDRIGRKATLITTLLLTGLRPWRSDWCRPMPASEFGGGAADLHPPGPGHRRRRRMGRLRYAGDGMEQ